MSDTQIVLALAIGALLIVVSGCVILVVIVRLRRVVSSQFEELEKLFGDLRTGQDGEKPIESRPEQ
jgi:hypothetical protein